MCLLFRVRAPNVSRRHLRDFARRLRVEVAGDRGFCCLITNDDEIRELNSRFRKQNYPTDVLSFPNEDGTLGEVAISWQRAKEQAREYGHTAEQEIQILMLHGLLHLMGMDHEKDRGRMGRAERRWRKRLSLPHGLIERVHS